MCWHSHPQPYCSVPEPSWVHFLLLPVITVKTMPAREAALTTRAFIQPFWRLTAISVDPLPVLRTDGTITLQAEDGFPSMFGPVGPYAETDQAIIVRRK
jgi:hypothetical protein